MVVPRSDLFRTRPEIVLAVVNQSGCLSIWNWPPLVDFRQNLSPCDCIHSSESMKTPSSSSLTCWSCSYYCLMRRVRCAPAAQDWTIGSSMATVAVLYCYSHLKVNTRFMVGRLTYCAPFAFAHYSPWNQSLMVAWRAYLNLALAAAASSCLLVHTWATHWRNRRGVVGSHYNVALGWPSIFEGSSSTSLQCCQRSKGAGNGSDSVALHHLFRQLQATLSVALLTILNICIP